MTVFRKIIQLSLNFSRGGGSLLLNIDMEHDIQLQQNEWLPTVSADPGKLEPTPPDSSESGGGLFSGENSLCSLPIARVHDTFW